MIRMGKVPALLDHVVVLCDGDNSRKFNAGNKCEERKLTRYDTREILREGPDTPSPYRKC